MSKLILIDEELAGKRLDKFLNHEFEVSFSAIQKIIRQKQVKVNNQKIAASHKLLIGDQVEIFCNLALRNKNNESKSQISATKISSLIIKKIISRIIYKDENLIAIDKPSGLSTQGGSGVNYSVDDLLIYLKFEKTENPKLVHRLDRDTSGILLIARNKQVAEMMFKIFKNKQIQKTYLALVKGEFSKKSGIINIPIRKKFVGKNEKVYRDEIEGREAITEYETIKNFAEISLMKLRPITGRTHQLRVHCKELGHAIINDVKYGGKDVIRKDISKNMCLHAYQIEINDYYGKKLTITSKIPDFAADFGFKSLN